MNAAFLEAVQAEHRRRWDDETCNECKTCYLADGYGSARRPDCPECKGICGNEDHVEQLLDEICEHGLLLGDWCDPCVEEAEDEHRRIRRDLERQTSSVLR